MSQFTPDTVASCAVIYRSLILITFTFYTARSSALTPIYRHQKGRVRDAWVPSKPLSLDFPLNKCSLSSSPLLVFILHTPSNPLPIFSTTSVCYDTKFYSLPGDLLPDFLLLHFLQSRSGSFGFSHCVDIFFSLFRTVLYLSASVTSVHLFSQHSF